MTHEDKLTRLIARARDTSCLNVRRVLINRIDILSALYGVDVDACELLGDYDLISMQDILPRPQSVLLAH